ncbi:MAG: HD domain-containing protein [Candidatus Falkowbacteria bacterium]
MIKKTASFMGALSHKAFQSQDTLGRQCKEDEDLALAQFLDPFEIDIWKIKSSKSFRALAGKTQVWPLSANPLVRNRLTHTLEVEAIAVMIAQVLGLNVSLTRAIALSHDLGHAPFGHMFERIISEITGIKFRHEFFGPLLMQKIERQGKGINASFEVLEGDSRHSRGDGKLITEINHPSEYGAVVCADKIGYTPSDVNDCLRMGYLKKTPTRLKHLGKNQREQVNSCLLALFKESAECGYVSFSTSKQAIAFEDARQWMYKNVYHKLDQEPDRIGNEEHIRRAYSFVSKYFNFNSIDTAVALATMTDREIITLSEMESGPTTVRDIKKLEHSGFMERLKYCQGVGYTEEDMKASWSWAKK